MVNPQFLSRDKSHHSPFPSDVAHVLPVLFPFTTPGKYCHRAIASFCKHVTGMQREPLSSADHSTSPTPPNETLKPQVLSPTVQISRIYRAASSVKRRSWWSRPSAQATGEPSGNKADHTSGTSHRDHEIIHQTPWPTSRVREQTATPNPTLKAFQKRERHWYMQTIG